MAVEEEDGGSGGGGGGGGGGDEEERKQDKQRDSCRFTGKFYSDRDESGILSSIFTGSPRPSSSSAPVSVPLHSSW